jgi:AcrR family transcriptional regulator
MRGNIKRPSLVVGETMPPRPLQQRSLQKGGRLKAAALALFGERGYEGTSVDDIARRAGLAAGGFYLHFRSKRQLLLSLMDELLARLESLQLAVPAGDDTRSALHSLLTTAFDTDLEFLGVYRAWQDAVLSDPDRAVLERRIRRWTTARVETVFRGLAGRAGARVGTDIPALARVMDTLFWSLLAQASHLSAAGRRQWIDTITHVIYHALFTDSSV